MGGGLRVGVTCTVDTWTSVVRVFAVAATVCTVQKTATKSLNAFVAAASSSLNGSIEMAVNASALAELSQRNTAQVEYLDSNIFYAVAKKSPAEYYDCPCQC